jgi:hypothetical protein
MSTEGGYFICGDIDFAKRIRHSICSLVMTSPFGKGSSKNLGITAALQVLLSPEWTV